MLTKKSLEETKQIIGGLISDYEEEIQKTFDNLGEVSISISAKLYDSTKGVAANIGITFTTGKVKDNVNVVVDTKQLSLPGMEGK